MPASQPGFIITMTQTPRIGIATDSSSLLPPELADQFRERGVPVSVVPIDIIIDESTHRDGIDLDADTFWARYESGGDPSPVTTSQPSPGVFAAAYNELAEQGVDDILSIHVGSALSGTLNSARLGADLAATPVHLVDTGTMSFGVSCCIWDAVDAIAAGARPEDAAAAAVAVADRVRTAFILQAMDVARASGRMRDELSQAEAAADANDSAEVSVMVAGPHDRFEIAGSASDIDSLCDLMAATMTADGQPIRVGISLADSSTEPFADGLRERLVGRADVTDVVMYRVGPSIGAHTGPGTAGGFWF